MNFTDLTPAAQAAYADLHEMASLAEMQRSIANLTGSFAAKTIKARKYWYFQYRDLLGKVRQVYIGPDTAQVLDLIGCKNAAPVPTLAPHAKSAIALGCTPMMLSHYRIVKRLSDYGFFRAGGVLVGTHAYLAAGNVLGVSWHDSTRTQDVDFAHTGNNMSIALPADIDIDVHGAIQSLEMGLLPITSFEGQPGATYLNPNTPDLRLDFLTSLHRGNGKPVTRPNLNVALQPLKFMEFSLLAPIRATVFSAEGGVVVNIPDPVRYALHKLLVYGERESQYRTKAIKDLRQAASLIDYYWRNRPDELEAAKTDMASRGRGWLTRLNAGWKAVGKLLDVPNSGGKATATLRR